MSRTILPKTSVKITAKEAALCKATDAKLLFTTYKGRNCALTIQNDRLLAASFFPQVPSKIGAIYIGKVKNVVQNLNAYFVEIANGEICFLSLKNAAAPYLLNRRFDGRILEGDELLVQVICDAQKTKRASVTAEVTLSNDYFALFLGSTKINYSHKLSPDTKKAVNRLFTELALQKNGCLLQGCDYLLSISQSEKLRSEGIQYEKLILPPIGMIVRTKAEEWKSLPEKKDSPIPVGQGNSSKLMKSFFDLTAQFIKLLYFASHRSCFSCLKEAPLPFQAAIQQYITDGEYPWNPYTQIDPPASLKEEHSKQEQSSMEKELSLDGQFSMTEECAMTNCSTDMEENHSMEQKLSMEEGLSRKEPYSTAEKRFQEKKSNEHFLEIITDQKSLYHQLEQYVNSECFPAERNIKVRLYQDDLLSLSKLYSIERKLETALGNRVWLKSGGYLVIEHTEALTVIDVNSGKFESKKDAENAYRKINLEAAWEIAFQLRLRNLSGIIIVDFINMESAKANKELLEYLRAAVKYDKVKTGIVDMTPLGLVEITRKKGNKPLREQFENNKE